MYIIIFKDKIYEDENFNLYICNHNDELFLIKNLLTISPYLDCCARFVFQMGFINCRRIQVAISVTCYI